MSTAAPKKETLEALVKQLRKDLDGALEVAEARALRLDTLEADLEQARARVLAMQNDHQALKEWFAEFYDREFVPLSESFFVLRPKVEGRNKSSSEKRDMTDADALACLTGEFRQFNHKNAAAEMGLTYAQIYSCRLEYTFKHVHKELRDKGWKNPWSK